MEYWYMATGPYHWMKLHEAHMQSQPFVLPAKTAQGQTVEQQMHGILEPVQLYRYVIPREGLPLVMNTLGAERKDVPNGLNLQAKALRIALGLSKFPNVLPEGGTLAKMPVSVQHLQIIPLGIKDDGPDRIMATTGAKQEPL